MIYERRNIRRGASSHSPKGMEPIVRRAEHRAKVSVRALRFRYRPSYDLREINEPLSHYENAWERLYRVEDPFDYDSPYEQLKYERTLALLPQGTTIGRALELGCSEGRFTALLAQRAVHVRAIDISKRALARAKQRCASLANVELVNADFFNQEMEGRWDLIICRKYYITSHRVITSSNAWRRFVKPLLQTAFSFTRLATK